MNEEVKALDASALRWRCDPEQFEFQTTDDLEDLHEFLGQARALDAVRFGIRIRRDGYNLYVIGPPGVGKRTIVQSFLEQKSASEGQPSDWCYVNNFEDSHKPNVLELPASRGAEFVRDMEELIDDLRTSIPAALESDDHKDRRQEIEKAAKGHQEKTFKELSEKAASKGVQVIRTPQGFALAPVRDGEVLSPEEYEDLPVEEKGRIQQVVEELQEELKELVERAPQVKRDTRDKVKEVNRKATSIAVRGLFATLKKRYAKLPKVVEHLKAVRSDVVDNVDEFSPAEDEPAALLGVAKQRRSPLEDYRVNLIVDNSKTEGAPVIYEEHPSFQNLLGRVEYEQHMGTLVTGFTHIKPGALHRANGGYLVIEAIRLFQQPYAWEGLKRALYGKHIRVQSLAEELSLISTVSLEPEPIPLDVKIALLGGRMLYYMLYQHDHDFAELFKVAADFEEQMDCSPENCLLYAKLIATLIHREKHLPFDRTAVARVIEQSARVASDSEKLTTHMRTVADLIREADYWAGEAESETVTEVHVQEAIDKQVFRADRLRERVQEEIQRGTVLIDTDGEQVAQINGLAVLDMGNFAFGRPSRITATARLGKGEVVDIEREVDLGGAIHSKGVLILSSFLASRYAKDHPLSLSASLVFEQSYGMVDGDSASVAELCALLSALSGIPIKQSFAVTGSVNQHGQVQPIGGANEKIEGFFDVCRARGLTGDQGVLIPSTNVKHLMLRQDLIAATVAGKFHVYPIETVDQAITLLTGVPAGVPDAEGQYPEETVNGRVAARLLEMFNLRREYGREPKPEKSNEGEDQP
ncbi:MAG: AAA family ATPase [Planctomycetes bacterium]|nr:AAA family ATPase [Planctomycetota bacterium]MBL7041665.1 AAA family ATPase [Pirellulaceae bacterium]